MGAWDRLAALDEPLQQCAQTRGALQRSAQSVHLVVADDERRALEAALGVVEAEPDRPAARGLTFVVLEQLDDRLVVPACVGGLLDDLAVAPVVAKRSWKRASG